MALYEITYRIKNKYDNLVHHAHYRLMLQIAVQKAVSTLKERISCNLVTSPYKTVNYAGFPCCNYRIEQAFHEIEFCYKAKIRTVPVDPFDFKLSTPEQDHQTLNSLDFICNHGLHTVPTPLTCLEKSQLIDFPSFTADKTVFDYALEINAFINQHLEYQPESTNVNTTAKEVAQQRTGVCQDFSHLFLAIMRYYKIPTRYTSGYLCPGENIIGDSQLHAWVEVFLPNIGWKGFDPTNNLLIDHNYFKITHGVDYNDCSPIKGIINTSGSQSSEHRVQIVNQ